MQQVDVFIKNLSSNTIPQYATLGSSGVDVKAFLSESIVLHPLERVLVPTGLFVEIPLGFEIQVRPRSGLAINSGITCLNTPGTIDSDYRGEIKVILINLSNTPFAINDGDRIAQMVLQKVEKINFIENNSLAETDRNTNGFGSTGIK